MNIRCQFEQSLLWPCFSKSAKGLSFEDLIVTVTSILTIFCALLWPFLLCHYGTFATERIRSLNRTVYNANWVDYPIDLRKHIILIIAQSQSDITFNGFGILSCNLEIFGKVRKGFVFSTIFHSDLWVLSCFF